MKSLFVSYYSIPAKRRTYIITVNQKVAVAHVLWAINPATLKDGLESDLVFSQHQLKKDFTKFSHHSVSLSDAFQLFDDGRREKGKAHGKDDKTGTGGNTPPCGTHNTKTASNSRNVMCIYGKRIKLMDTGTFSTIASNAPRRKGNTSRRSYRPTSQICPSQCNHIEDTSLPSPQYNIQLSTLTLPPLHRPLIVSPNCIHTPPEHLPYLK